MGTVTRHRALNLMCMIAVIIGFGRVGVIVVGCIARVMPNALGARKQGPIGLGVEVR